MVHEQTVERPVIYSTLYSVLSSNGPEQAFCGWVVGWVVVGLGGWSLELETRTRFAFLASLDFFLASLVDEFPGLPILAKCVVCCACVARGLPTVLVVCLQQSKIK